MARQNTSILLSLYVNQARTYPDKPNMSKRIEAETCLLAMASEVGVLEGALEAGDDPADLLLLPVDWEDGADVEVVDKLVNVVPNWTGSSETVSVAVKLAPLSGSTPLQIAVSPWNEQSYPIVNAASGPTYVKLAPAGP